MSHKNYHIMVVLLICLCNIQINAQNNPNSNLVRSTTGISGSTENISVNNSNYIIQQSIGQASVIGTFTNDNYIIRQGFIQPNVLAKIVDKKTPLNLEATAYPNPFKEYISILFKEKISNQISVNIYDMLGRLVFEKKYSASQNIKVELRNLAVADYILKVKTNNKQQIVKIIKDNQ